MIGRLMGSIRLDTEVGVKKYMADKDFEQLLESVRQMGDHLKGKKVQGVRVTYRTKPITSKEVKDVRVKVLKVTQEEFARIVGEGLGAIRTWEQGTRRPGGAATKLIRMIRTHPERAKELLTV
jgi:putative transcriptional regulator